MNKSRVLSSVIKGYPNYSVTNTGLIINNKRDVTLTPWTTLDGDLRVQLSAKIGGAVVRKKFSVHRLVAVAYVLNTGNHSCVRSIDGDRTNVHADNLEWYTRLTTADIVRPSAVSVEMLDVTTDTRRTFASMAELGRYLSRPGISLIHLIRESSKHPYLGKYKFTLNEKSLLRPDTKSTVRVPVYVYDKVSDVTTEYPSMYSAGYFTGLCNLGNLIRRYSTLPASQGYIISREVIVDTSDLSISSMGASAARYAYRRIQASGYHMYSRKAT